MKWTLDEAAKQAEHLRQVGCTATMEPLGRIAVPGPTNRADSPQSEFARPGAAQREE